MDDIRVLRAVVLVMAVAALLTATVLDGLLMRYVMRPFIRQMLERSGGTPYPPSIMFMVSGSRLGVLRTARHVLGALLGMLRADSTTNARGEIGALDFDPLLNSQDPCESYQAGPATQIGDRWDVPVFAVCGGNRASTGEVIVELEERRPAWMIRNLRYPALDSDLRAVLRPGSGVDVSLFFQVSSAPSLVEETTPCVNGAAVHAGNPAVVGCILI